MSNNQTEVINTEIHPQAGFAIKKYTHDFATSLLLQAKTIAYRSKADVVLSSHVDEALDKIYKDRKQSSTKELLIVLGGAFFGAFIQGFISELSSGNAVLIATYVFLGFIGMFMVFLGLRK